MYDSTMIDNKLNIMVEKRNGTFVKFDFEKINIAVNKAITELNKQYVELSIDQIDNLFYLIKQSIAAQNTTSINIETIQDIIITSMKNLHLDFLAYLYSNYRNQKEQERISFENRAVKIIDKYIKKDNWEIKENSNMEYSVQGLNIHLFSKFNKTYWKMEVLGTDIYKHHESGDFHIHDLYLLAPYCVGWDLKDLLLNGFSGVPSKVSCFPPKHFDSACGQLVNFLYTMQGEAAGAVAFSNVDTLLAPFIERDGLVENRDLLMQNMQKMIYNLNVPTRVGFQCLSYDTEIYTPNGWINYNNVNVDDTITVFDMDTKIIKTDTVLGVNIFRYKGTMCNFISDNMDQLVTPNHRCVILSIIDDNKYVFEDADKVLSKKETFTSITCSIDNNTNIISWDNEDINTLAYVNDYDNVVWCPTTNTGTVIARRNGKIFITGNSPFTNFTLDLECPEHMKNEPIIIDGKYDTEHTYGEYQKGIDAFNDAFCSIMMKGDKNNKIFSFPIPTYCIDDKFNWDRKENSKIWDMTSKFGIPYFANYINSDMSKEDSRSMCPIHGQEYVLVKSPNLKKLSHCKIKYLKNVNDVYDVYSDGKFVKGRFQIHPDQKMLKITLVNGHTFTISETHLNFILKNQNSNVIEEAVGKDLEKGMYLPYSTKEYHSNNGSYKLGYLVGAYAGDGSIPDDSSVLFSLNDMSKSIVIDNIINITQQYFGITYSIRRKDHLVSLSVHSKSLVGVCKDFVIDSGINKHLSPKLFTMSKKFKLGFIQGYLNTDGGSKNRIYTASEKMVKSLNMLAATMGTITSVTCDTRSGRYSENPVYGVIIYKDKRISYSDRWFRKFDKIWVKIKDIKPLGKSTGYCFEVIDDEPMFTVGTTGILTHNCRLRLSLKEIRKKGGGLFGADSLTGSIGVITLNLPRIGYLAKDKKDFFTMIKKQINIASDALIKKTLFIEEMTEQGFYPYSKIFLKNVKKQNDKYWANHFLTIGIIGMHEACINFFKNPAGIESKEGYNFTIELMNYMNSYLIELQEKTNYLYNLEAAPAESTGFKLLHKDKEKYPDMYCFKTSDNVQYTNSTNLPVDTKKDVFEVVDYQSEIQSKYSGGSVTHLFLNQSIHDPEVTKNLVKQILSNYKVPYISITPTFSICEKHGMIPGNVKKCPICKSEVLNYSRIVGYFRPTKSWNLGKKQEFLKRTTYEFNR